VQLDRRLSDKDDDDAPQYQFPVMHVDVKAGGATTAVLGGPGQVVSGRLTGLDSYKGVTLRIHPRAPHIGMPGDEAQWNGWAALRKDSLGSTVFRDAVPVEPDGTFRIEGLVPERYQIIVNPADDKLRGGAEVTVEPAGGERRQEPLEIRVTRG
jgi:hypothetical protein